MTTPPDTVLITGNTFPVKDKLKALGGVWSPSEKGWRVPKLQKMVAEVLVGNAEQVETLPFDDLPEPITGKPRLFLFITGGRSYRFTPSDIAILDRVAELYDITEVVHGAAPGADTGANNWAVSKGLSVHRFPANWNTQGNSAGPQRNTEMCEYSRLLMASGKETLLIAFPGDNGTADMTRKAIRAGMAVQQSREFTL